VFGGTGHDEAEESVTYADTHILDLRRPVPLWKVSTSLRD
jgi:hypothetical protein